MSETKYKSAGKARMLYEVTIRCPGTLETVIEVEAESRETAEDEALKIVRSGKPTQCWEAAGIDGDPSKEEIARAMEGLPTEALEWAVKFEALSHRGKT